jgi:heme exporter protein C
MKDRLISRLPRLSAVWVIVAACFAFSCVLIFFVAPTEATMGEVQKILYLHVSVAWCGLACCLVMGYCSAMYLGCRRLEWDHWSQASAETGWLCTTLTLVTGSAWAHEAWGTWWTWDPRLTASLLLWIIYTSILLLRRCIEDPHRRGRVGGLLALVGVCDVPLVMMATRWFRGIHPVSPEMDARMRLVLMASVACCTLLFASLIVQRRRQLELLEHAMQLEANAWYTRGRRQC